MTSVAGSGDPYTPSHQAAIPAGWAWTAYPAGVGGFWGAVSAVVGAAGAETVPAGESAILDFGQSEPLPLGLDRIAESLSLSLASVDAAIEQCVERVDDLGDWISDLFAESGTVALTLQAAAAVAAGVAVDRVTRRRRRRWATEAAREDALNPWALGPIPEAV